MNMSAWRVPALLAVLFAVQQAPGAAFAAEPSPSAYPQRPVRLIVGFAPGGADVPARILAQALHEKLGQPFIVDNRPGAGGIIGAELAAKATADGHTLLFATASFPVTAVTHRKLPYDPLRDFAAVAPIGSVPFTLVTHPSVPAGTVREFVALAKSSPGKLNYASTGTGAVGHLASVLFVRQAGIQGTHVPYKGTGPAVNAVVAGEVQFMLPHLMAALPHVRSGKLRALAVASPERSPLAPALPTFAESGIPLVEGTWYGVLAPARTPKSATSFLNKEITALIRSGASREKLAALGIALAPAAPEAFGRFLRGEIEKWSRLVREEGIGPE